MEQSPHVMLTGAEAFAHEHDVERVPNDFFYTERRRQLERAQQRECTPSGGNRDG